MSLPLSHPNLEDPPDSSSLHNPNDNPTSSSQSLEGARTKSWASFKMHPSKKMRGKGKRRISTRGQAYDIPESHNTLNESPVESSHEDPATQEHSFEDGQSHESKKHPSRKSLRQRRASTYNGEEGYNMPDNFMNLDELASPLPIENPYEEPVYRHHSLEETKSTEQKYSRNKKRRLKGESHHLLQCKMERRTKATNNTRCRSF